MSDRAERRPAAVLTWLASGEQRIIHAEDIAAMPELGEGLTEGPAA